MSKFVTLKIVYGDFETGFRTVLRIAKNGELNSTEITGELPPYPSLPKKYENWQLSYRNNRGIRDSARAIASTQQTNFSIMEAARELEYSINDWLNSMKFRDLRDKLVSNLQGDDKIELVIQTDDVRLWRLPWHFWDVVEENQFEVSFSASEYHKVARIPIAKKKKQVRILVILGESSGIDTDRDLKLLQQKLPSAYIHTLIHPTIKELSDELWKKEWDILFFADRSSSEDENFRGVFQINEAESLRINELKYALIHAIERGLKLAFFNSYDGLGLARELADIQIPATVVMRERAPDEVALKFLEYFLNAFATKEKSLTDAVREARGWLRGMEDKYACASWLPALFHNPAEFMPSWRSLLEESEDSRWQAAQSVRGIALDNLLSWQDFFPSLQISLLFREIAIILNQAFVRTSNFYSFIKRQTTIFLLDIAGKYKNIVDFCIFHDDRNTAFFCIEKDKQKYLNQFVRLTNARGDRAYFYEFNSLIPSPETAIVEFFFTNNKLVTMLILPNRNSPVIFEDMCLELNNNPLKTLPQDWISKLTAKTKKDNETDETLEYLPTTIDQISNLLNLKNLVKDIPQEIKHLIIIPHKYLHLFPIHALSINENELLIDRFSIQYFPNLKVWNICHNRDRNPRKFIGIENPTQDKDLIFAKAEISNISKRKLFKTTDIFSGQKATRSTILKTANNYHCLHFSGHAEYNYKNPLDSYLMLSDKPDENLTLNTILKNLKMPDTDLVTLSACCTGVVDVFQPTDEYLGLATAFLLVGAKAVIGSLWKVNSIATAFLLDEFYRQLDETENKALALQKAQNWLRRRSAEELRERAKTWDLTMLESKERARLRAALKSFKGVPFENPYYWAAFILTGC